MYSLVSNERYVPRSTAVATGYEYVGGDVSESSGLKRLRASCITTLWCGDVPDASPDGCVRDFSSEKARLDDSWNRSMDAQDIIGLFLAVSAAAA